MKKIGLTGGIGSGKTYVSNIFSSLGIPIFYSDDKAKELMINSESLKESINSHFSEDVFPDGKLDKEKLSQIIFSNKKKLNELNAIVHPIVKIEFDDWCRKQNSDYIIKEAAILFESKSHLELDKIICVSAPLDLRIDRVIKRDRVNKNQVQDIMRNQLPQKDKENQSHYIIINNEEDLLLPQIIKIHKELIN